MGIICALGLNFFFFFCVEKIRVFWDLGSSVFYLLSWLVCWNFLIFFGRGVNLGVFP